MPKCNKRNEKNNENLILLNTPKIPCHQTRDYYNLVLSSSEFTNHDTDFTALSFLSIIALNNSDAAIDTKIYL